MDQPPKNFTARAGRWSASHRKTAILGWLAFVFAAFALGSASGTVTLKSPDIGNGESRAASKILARQFPRARAVCAVIGAWFAILFTGRYPRGLFRFVEGVLRYATRILGYAFMLVTDEYHPSNSVPDRLTPSRSLCIPRDRCADNGGGLRPSRQTRSVLATSSGCGD